MFLAGFKVAICNLSRCPLKCQIGETLDGTFRKGVSDTPFLGKDWISQFAISNS
jgi:hypothetical protein